MVSEPLFATLELGTISAEFEDVFRRYGVTRSFVRWNRFQPTGKAFAHLVLEHAVCAPLGKELLT